MTPVLRPMQPADLSWVLPAEQAFFRGDPPWSETMFREELAGVPDTRWYTVAETPEGEPLGWTGLWFLSPEQADLQTVAVLEAHRRRGIGSVLLSAAIAEARRRGVDELLLEVRADNAPALALYADAGFQRLALRRGYYGNGRHDGVVMRLELATEPTVPTEPSSTQAGEQP